MHSDFFSLHRLRQIIKVGKEGDVFAFGADLRLGDKSTVFECLLVLVKFFCFEGQVEARRDKIVTGGVHLPTKLHQIRENVFVAEFCAVGVPINENLLPVQ